MLLWRKRRHTQKGGSSLSAGSDNTRGSNSWFRLLSLYGAVARMSNSISLGMAKTHSDCERHTRAMSGYRGTVPVHDDSRIAKISRSCRTACYPGDAGLSVVHFFGLSLPPIVHDDITTQQGPEPSYVENDVNGFVYEKSGGESALAKTLGEV